MDDMTWGLDVSTNRAKTAAVALDWSTPGEARVVEVRRPLRPTDIAPLISEHRESTWAVDVPFGWPDLFVALMAERHTGPLPAEVMPAAADWEKWRTRKVAQRLTGRFLTNDPRIGTRPLPASFQLLGATAAMWVLVEAQLVTLGVEIDRARLEGAVCETKPSAGLSAWGFGKAKQTWSELHFNFGFLTADEHLIPQFVSDDVCDAVICALVALRGPATSNSRAPDARVDCCPARRTATDATPELVGRGDRNRRVRPTGDPLAHVVHFQFEEAHGRSDKPQQVRVRERGARDPDPPLHSR